MSEGSGTQHGIKYWGCATNSVGLNIQTSVSGGDNRVRILGFSSDGDKNVGDEICTVNLPDEYANNIEFVYDIEHGLVYLDDEVVFTIEPSNNIYNMFCIECIY